MRPKRPAPITIADFFTCVVRNTLEALGDKAPPAAVDYVKGVVQSQCKNVYRQCQKIAAKNGREEVMIEDFVWNYANNANLLNDFLLTTKAYCDSLEGSTLKRHKTTDLEVMSTIGLVAVPPKLYDELHNVIQDLFLYTNIEEHRIEDMRKKPHFENFFLLKLDGQTMSWEQQFLGWLGLETECIQVAYILALFAKEAIEIILRHKNPKKEEDETLQPWNSTVSQYRNAVIRIEGYRKKRDIFSVSTED